MGGGGIDRHARAASTAIEQCHQPCQHMHAQLQQRAAQAARCSFALDVVGQLGTLMRASQRSHRRHPFRPVRSGVATHQSTMAVADQMHLFSTTAAPRLGDLQQ